MFEIKPVKEHFEVLLNGNFFCSADTLSEAEREIKEREIKSMEEDGNDTI